MAIDPNLPLDVATQGLSLGYRKAQGSNIPEGQAAQLGAGTQGLIGQQRAMAGENTQQIAGETMAGAQARGQAAQLNPEEVAQKATALGMANPSDLGAQLAARGQRYYQSDIQRLQNQANMGAGERQLSREQTALHNEQQLNKVHMQAYNQALENEQNRRTARNRAVADFMGLAGAGAGMAVGRSSAKNNSNQPAPSSGQGQAHENYTGSDNMGKYSNNA